MTTRTATSYYVALGLFFALQAVVAVFQSGQTLTNQQAIADLQKTKTELLAERQDLEQHLAFEHSLLHITSNPVYNQFQPVSQVEVVTVPTTVAWR